MRRPHVLIVDDEADICLFLTEALSPQPWVVEWTTRPFDALERIKSELFELVILDIKMPEISGIELLPKIKRASPETAVLVMSAFGSVPIAVSAMKEGAEDYLEKPFSDLEVLRLSAARLVESARTRMENQSLRQQLEEKFQLDGFVSASPRMHDVFALVRKVAPLYTTVLISGDTGTGKELIARTLHRNSKRSQNPFISVNCGGLPEGLLESLLFGHEKGSFTGAVRRTRGYFEEAEGGTLFLDEVGETPALLQVKLLRVLQERTFQRVGGSEEIPIDVRMIAATNKDLTKAVKEGSFRQDLFYRLNVITIALPALKERKEDIPMLARYFTDKYSKAFARSDRELTSDAVTYLYRQEWPGNVRQLENAIERAVALSENKKITSADFSNDLSFGNETSTGDGFNLPIREARLEFERRYLIEMLKRNRGNVTSAAKAAGLPRQNYHRKMKQLSISNQRRVVEIPDEDEELV
ncbi:MAG: sigma-54 dependent transcriptional regulator [bacterium]|nr:sigma-54 dependent transcriptional regulator [bacterium]